MDKDACCLWYSFKKVCLKRKSLHKAPECIQSMDIVTGLFYIKLWSYRVPARIRFTLARWVIPAVQHKGSAYVSLRGSIGTNPIKGGPRPKTRNTLQTEVLAHKK